MSKQASEIDFVVAMGRLGIEDRDLYRRLRAEAWEMVRENHQGKTEHDLALWLAKAS